MYRKSYLLRNGKRTKFRIKTPKQLWDWLPKIISRELKQSVISYHRNFFDHTEEPSPFLAPVLRSGSVIFCPTADNRWKRKYRVSG